MRGAAVLNAVGISLEFERMLAAPQALGITEVRFHGILYFPRP